MIEALKRPRIIGIRFSDNDFYNVISRFLELMGDVKLENYAPDYGRSPVTKDAVAELFNRSVPGLYWLVQNRLGYNKDWDAASYLKITPDRVLFDEEVKAHSDRCDGWDNGEFYVLDASNPDRPYVYVI